MHAVRKWMVGDAIPTQERLHIFAVWLAISPQWLRFGDATHRLERSNTELSNVENVSVLADIARLSAADKLIVTELVRLLVRIPV